MCKNFMYVDAEGKTTKRTYEEKFNEFENDVDGAFLYLLNKLETLWSDQNYHNLKKVCVRDIRLPETLRKSIKDAPNIEETFDLLKTSPYFTWFEIRILQRTAKMVENSEARCLIDSYEKCIFSKRCSEVQPYFYKQYIIPDQLTLVIAKLNKNSDEVLVSDLVNYCNRLSSIIETPTDSTTLVSNKPGCIEMHVVIPIHYSYHAYNKAKSMMFKL